MSENWNPPWQPRYPQDRDGIPPHKRRRLPARPIIDITRSSDNKPRFAFQPLNGLPHIPNPCNGSCRSGPPDALSPIFIMWFLGIDRNYCRECPYRPNTANAWPRAALPPRKP